MGLLIGIGQTRPQTPYDYFYGIEWDITVSNPKPKRIGKMELHASLPVQSLMRRCVLRDNGTIAYYLHANDSTKRDNSENANLDGTDGQVMVEIPTCYVKFEADGNKRRFLMSTQELPGFHKWERCFVSAYEATIHRPTNTLSSVVNATPDYRGGDNNASRDGDFSSLLGRPASKFNMTQARTFARNRGSSSWNCHTYHIHKVLFWFFAVEYCNFNSQDSFNASFDENGCRQGGLGTGSSSFSGWRDFGWYPFLPCGLTNSLGNSSGVVVHQCTISNTGVTSPIEVISYRGVETPFGHIQKMVDGAKCLMQSSSSGGKTLLYVTPDKELWGNLGIEGSFLRGELPRSEGYIRELILGDDGEIAPMQVGAGSTSYFCDLYNIQYPGVGGGFPRSGVSERILCFGGNGIKSTEGGLLCTDTGCTESTSSTFMGTRLSFIP